MKKLLFVAIIMVSVVHEEKAMDYKQHVVKDKDFSKQFFNELKDEYDIENNRLVQRQTILAQQRNSLETNLNLKKLNLNIDEKKLKKNVKRSKSSFDSFMNTLGAVSCFGQSISIMNDTDELKPIQNELIAVSSELLSNMKLYSAFQELEYEYPITRVKNPYLKKITTNNPFIEQANKKESKAYDEALFSLKATKKEMEYNLANVSWFQWLWNYRAYKNYQKSIQTLDEEIALCKGQNKIVSSEKIVDREKKLSITMDEYYERRGSASTDDGLIYLEKSQCYIPKLTYREVFTRSNMKRSLFDQVKADRE
jgi:hypothetical protein